MSEIPQKASWEIDYEDGNGVEFAVCYDAKKPCGHSHTRAGVVRIESSGVIEIPAERLDWLLSCLSEARYFYSKVGKTKPEKEDWE